MAYRQLIFRLAGISSLCLAVLAAPLPAGGRIVALTAVALGIGFASVLSDYERLAGRFVGPAILAVALFPPSGPWIAAQAIALFVLGFAASSRVAMSRIAPAAGLPVIALAFRTGHALDPVLVAAWSGTALVTVVAGTAAWSIGPGPRLGRATGDGATVQSPPVVFGWRRAATAAFVVAIVAPVSYLGAAAIDDLFPMLARSGAGQPGGPALVSHPGLTGGLDAGAPVTLTDDVVLRVEADRPMYWRGTTYEHWDGRRWTSGAETTAVAWTGDGPKPLPVPPRADGRPDDGADGAVDRAADGAVEGPAAGAASGAADGAAPARPLPEAERIVQRFTAERAGLDVVLGAWRIDELWLSAEQATVGSDGSVLLDSPLQAGASWTVASDVVPADADDLRLADPLGGPADLAILGRFGFERDVTTRTAELAEAVTADAPTTYDKVEALMDWMDANIQYTRDIQPLASSGDAVDHLLFESRRGYCEQIGSALVVMLRSLGIPARLVVGYVPSAYDPASGTWLSRGTDAHAWAEVYFPGVGWRGFDPTAGVPVSPEQASTPPPLGTDWPTIAVLAGLVVGSIVAVAALRRRSVGSLAASGTALGRILGRKTAPLAELQHRFDACGDRLDLRWSPTMTLREKGHQLVEAGIEAEPVDRVTRSMERLIYRRGAGDGDRSIDGDGGNESAATNDAIDAIDELERHLAGDRAARASGAGDTAAGEGRRRRVPLSFRR